MNIIVTGGIGSGKSTIAKALTTYFNAISLSIDSIVNDVWDTIELEGPYEYNVESYNTYHKLIDVFGFGSINKKSISDKVFNDPSLIPSLEEIINPLIIKEISKYNHILNQKEVHVIIEFPTYFSNPSLYKDLLKVDFIIGIFAKRDDIVKRIVKRNGWTLEKIDKVITYQVANGLSLLRSKSDFVIDNTIDLYQKTDAQIICLLIDQFRQIKQQMKIHKLIKSINDRDSNVIQRTEDAFDEVLSEVPKSQGIVSGSFDPITKGHLWLIEKALSLVDIVYVVIASNPNKKYLFSEAVKQNLIFKSLKERFTENQINRIEICVLETNKMLVTKARELNVNFIFRGIRNFTDYEYENQLNSIQKTINPDVETVFLLPPKELTDISSSTIKTLMKYDEGQQVAKKYVTNFVFEQLSNKLYYNE